MRGLKFSSRVLKWIIAWSFRERKPASCKFAGHSNWLRVYIVCKNFNRGMYSILEVWLNLLSSWRVASSDVVSREELISDEYSTWRSSLYQGLKLIEASEVVKSPRSTFQFNLDNGIGHLTNTNDHRNQRSSKYIRSHTDWVQILWITQEVAVFWGHWNFCIISVASVYLQWRLCSDPDIKLHATHSLPARENSMSRLKRDHGSAILSQSSYERNSLFVLTFHLEYESDTSFPDTGL